MRKVWPSFVVLCLAVACDLGPDDGDDSDLRAPNAKPVSDWPNRAADAAVPGVSVDGGIYIPDGGSALPSTDASLPPGNGGDAGVVGSDASVQEDAGAEPDAGDAGDAGCPPEDEDAGEDAGDADPPCEPCALMLGDVCLD